MFRPPPLESPEPKKLKEIRHALTDRQFRAGQLDEIPKPQFPNGPDKLYQMFCESLAPTLVQDDSVSSFGEPTEEFTKCVDINGEFTKAVKQFFQEFKTPNAPSPLKKVSDLLDTHFFVGEVTHHSKQPKQFFTENAKELKEAGFEILFVEFLYYDHQADLDYFHKTGNMPKRLDSRLAAIDFSHGQGPHLRNMVIAAQKAKIRVVGIETEKIFKTQDNRYNHSYDNRVPFMNYSAFKIMQQEISTLPPGKKFSGMMGLSHFEDCPDNIVGVNKLMGARTVAIDFVEDSKFSNVELNSDLKLKIDEEELSLATDLYIKRNSQLPMDLKSLADACKIQDKQKSVIENSFEEPKISAPVSEQKKQRGP